MPKQRKKPRYTDAKIDEIVLNNQQLMAQVNNLQAQLRWLKRQVFGNKSEQIRYLDMPDQTELDLGSTPINEPPEATQTIQAHQRRKQPTNNKPEESGIDFDEDEVEIKVIQVPCPELEGDDADDYTVIGTQIDFRLAQRPSAYVMLKYERKIVKHLKNQQIITAPTPAGVFERNQWDVSFIAGILIEKFLYHQPLYRQHQRLTRNGIRIARASLTNIVHRTCQLLEPIVDAQRNNIMHSHTMAIDETFIKSGNKKKGKLHQSYFIPVYGDQDEIVFNYSASKSQQAIDAILADFTGSVLLTDGNSAYAQYAKKIAKIIHALCWAHTRRYFERAFEAEPEASRIALELIAQLYHQNGQIKASWPASKQLAYRAQHCQPVVNRFFSWCHDQRQRVDLLPSNPLAKALRYAGEREQALREFLTDPTIQLDTNHLERALRAIPMGRRNWLFCWTELGAKYVGIIQSLIVTCRLQSVDPSAYLIDVLQRVKNYPADQMIDLTPRVWKVKFGANPLISDL